MMDVLNSMVTDLIDIWGSIGRNGENDRED